jgi:hypothetical protein
MAIPPLLVGTVQVKVAVPLWPVTTTFPGADGAVAVGAGVAEFDAADSAPLPLTFVAWTVKVYAVPLVSPLTVQGLELHVAVPPGVPVTV